MVISGDGLIYACPPIFVHVYGLCNVPLFHSTSVFIIYSLGLNDQHLHLACGNYGVAYDETCGVIYEILRKFRVSMESGT